MTTLVSPVATPAPGAAARSAALFPHFICRLSGLPVDRVESLRALRCEALLVRLHELEGRLSARRDAVSAILHDVVRAREDGEARRRLVHLRRDLYNLRTAEPAGLAAADEALAPPERADVEAFAGLVRERAEVVEALRAAYGEEMPAARRRFRALLADPGFQKGLLLSSRTLHAAQGRYLEAPADRLGGKLEKTERGLLRYFTRTAMKATPFATLCAVVPGAFTSPAVGDTPIRLGGDPLSKRSLVRLNKQLYGVITRFLAAQTAIRPHLHVELNPTIGEEGDELAYLAVYQGREVFQRLERNPVVQLVAATVADRVHLPLGDLSRVLAGHPDVDATQEEAASYVDRLVEAGLLRFRFGIREQDVDWDLPLRALLESIPDERARVLAGFLGKLRRAVERFETAGTGERASILAECREELDAVRETLKLRGANLAGMLPFMEDATADAPVAIPRTPEVERMERMLESFVQLTRRLAAPRADQATMRHFFDAHYGEHVGSVPLLRFYEDYHREHLKEHLGVQRRAEKGDFEALKSYRLNNPFGLEFVDRLVDAERDLVALVSSRWESDPAAEQIDLCREDLAGILEGVPALSGDAASVAGFVEYVPADAERPARLILSRGGYSVGYGKFFSRFLHLLPPEVQGELLESSRALSDGFVAEICGDGNHNANLHPPLLPWEISYPTGESGAAEEQLPAIEIVVERHPCDPHALSLLHGPTGQRVIPVDLGFVTPTARPPLYQLLSRFTPPSEFHPRLPDFPHHVPGILRGGAGDMPADPAVLETLRAREEASRTGMREFLGSVSYCPRVVFENSIVLRRRQWVVPLALLPQRSADESALDFFLRVNRWRERHGIPREVYARLEPVYPGGGPPPAAEQGTAGEAEAPKPRDPRRFDRAMLNNLKPQYVDFASPLLAGLFGHMAPEGESYIAVLAERYPDGASLPEYAGERFATEQVIQINISDEHQR